MGTPTKEAIIGTFINGRNAQDDFLQLATNHGGTVFACIDYQGILQGTYETFGALAKTDYDSADKAGFILSIWRVSCNA